MEHTKEKHNEIEKNEQLQVVRQQPSCPDCKSMRASLLLMSVNHALSKVDCCCRGCGKLYSYQWGLGSPMQEINHSWIL